MEGDVDPPKSSLKGLIMTTDLFLGGLASLILAAVIIVALTTNKGEEISHDNNGVKPRDGGRGGKSSR